MISDKKEKNFYLYICFSTLILDIQLWTIYLLNNGIESSIIGVLETILQISILIFELPSSILADLFGKRKCLIISKILIIFYCIFLYRLDSIVFIILAFIFLGISEALASGTEDIIIYDIFKEDSEKSKLFKYNLFYSIIGKIGFIISVIGGSLFSLSYWNYMYLATIIFQILSIYYLLKIRVNNTYIVNNKAILKRKYLYNLKDNIFKKKYIYMTLGIILFTGSQNIISIFSPLFLYSSNFTILNVSIVTCIQYLLSCLITYIFSKKRFQNKVNIIAILIYIITIFITVLLLLTFKNNSMFIVLILISINNILSSCYYPVATTIINENIGDDIRATMNSVVNFLHTIVVMILSPLVGLLIQLNKFHLIFIISLVMSILTLYIFLSLWL